METAKLLHVDIKQLGCADNFEDTLKEEINSETSTFDEMDSLIEIFEKNDTTTKKKNEPI